jgi:predicted hydrolase (HD superfamily)
VTDEDNSSPDVTNEYCDCIKLIPKPLDGGYCRVENLCSPIIAQALANVTATLAAAQVIRPEQETSTVDLKDVYRCCEDFDFIMAETR